MKVQLLGTGSADGWPNPFCKCASCADARRSKNVRGQTGALVDGRMLIDCGPEIPATASRHGADLASVRTMLFTHSHPDHLGPAALLFRHWANLSTPLQIFAPMDVIDELKRWVAPTDPVQLNAISATETVDVDGYRITALRADHGDTVDSEAVLFDVSDGTGVRLLYATDTGPLPDETLAHLSDARLDLILLEETFGDHFSHGTRHLDLRSFPHELARLRQVGALTDETDVVAVHLSHHNPPTSALQRKLSAWGARVVPDGTVVTVGERTRAEGDPPARRPQRTLVLGGARSGKSTYAEQLVAAASRVTYVATAADDADDLDWTARLKAHRDRRPAWWTTVETTDVAGVISEADPQDTLLVDCLTVWLSRVMDAMDAWEGDVSLVDKHLEQLLDACRHTPANVVLVSNEVGQGVVPATRSGRLFRDFHGRMNAAVARECDRVVAMWAGRPVEL